MADFLIESSWVDGFSSLGLIPSSAAYKIQNKGTGTLVIQFTDLIPSSDIDEGLYISTPVFHTTHDSHLFLYKTLPISL